jgi:ABC-type uncharacterized transport system involved in gliding motility auxiliary subunit
VREAFRFLGFAGLVLMLFGLASYALTGVFDAWTAVHVAGGGVLLSIGVVLNLTRVRTTVAERGTRERARAAAGVALFAAILASANVLAARRPWRFDVTENKIHTLSEKTRTVVSGLDQPVEMGVFAATGDPESAAVEDLLKRYASLSPRLSWKMIDPEREPDLAEQLNVRRRGVVVARAGSTTAQSTGESLADLSEGVLTNLVLKVTRPGPRVVYFLTGHGEGSPDDPQSPEGLGALAAALRNENLEVRPLLLSASAKIPAEASFVVVAGPRKALLPGEVEALRSYFSVGGRLLLLLDPGVDAAVGPLLTDARLAMRDNVIVDLEEIPFLGTRLGLDPIIEDFPAHPITRQFKERIVLFQARSVDVTGEGGLPGAEARVVARTRASAWGSPDYRGILTTGRVIRSNDDLQGPLAVVAAATIAPSSSSPGASAKSASGARAVLIGDSDLARNAHLDDFFNREFMINTAHWLSGEDDLIAESPKGFRPSRLDMTEADYRTLFRFSVLLLPETLLILGLAVWWRRRSL